ncbi:MAG: hypothetical protein Q9202_000239 [Teloschistes flavicans]
MDASHLCHQEHCLVHIVYEAADLNQDRRECAAGARAARLDSTDIPAECSKHSPPCLLQHAALTMAEVYLIQFSILSVATGLSLPLSTQRPSSHLYPTFEAQLPLVCKLSHQAVKYNREDLLANGPTEDTWDRPDLICKYCSRVKAYMTITGLWAHIFYKHAEVDRADRLEEIRRTAALWSIYWQENAPDGGGKRNATMAKLNTAASATFTWEDIIAWKLRE